MSNFFVEQGRTRVFAEAYLEYAAGGKPAENAAHRKKGHFRMETNYLFIHGGNWIDPVAMLLG
jgi:hypothetical protein